MRAFLHGALAPSLWLHLLHLCCADDPGLDGYGYHTSMKFCDDEKNDPPVPPALWFTQGEEMPCFMEWISTKHEDAHYSTGWRKTCGRAPARPNHSRDTGHCYLAPPSPDPTFPLDASQSHMVYTGTGAYNCGKYAIYCYSDGNKDDHVTLAAYPTPNFRGHLNSCFFARLGAGKDARWIHVCSIQFPPGSPEAGSTVTDVLLPYGLNRHIGGALIDNVFFIGWDAAAKKLDLRRAPYLDLSLDPNVHNKRECFMAPAKDDFKDEWTVNWPADGKRYSLYCTISNGADRYNLPKSEWGAKGLANRCAVQLPQPFSGFPKLHGNRIEANGFIFCLLFDKPDWMFKKSLPLHFPWHQDVDYALTSQKEDL